MEVLLQKRGRSGQRVEVADLAEASKVVSAFQSAHGLGSSQVGRSHGQVYNDGAPVARVSYNGRVWAPDGKEIL